MVQPAGPGRDRTPTDPYNPTNDDALAARLDAVRRKLAHDRGPARSWIDRQHAVERRRASDEADAWRPPDPVEEPDASA